MLACNGNFEGNSKVNGFINILKTNNMIQLPKPTLNQKIYFRFRTISGHARK